MLPFPAARHLLLSTLNYGRPKPVTSSATLEARLIRSHGIVQYHDKAEYRFPIPHSTLTMLWDVWCHLFLWDILNERRKHVRRAYPDIRDGTQEACEMDEGLHRPGPLTYSTLRPCRFVSLAVAVTFARHQPRPVSQTSHLLSHISGTTVMHWCPSKCML